MLREIVSDAFRNQTIAEVALEKANKRPEQEIIFHENEPAIEIASIVEEAGCLANSLRRLGMIAGDVISFQLPSWREAVAIDLAASILGLVVNPIIPIYREKELKFILNDANTKLLFIPEKFRSTNYLEMIGSIRSSLPKLEHVIVVRGVGNLQQLNYGKLIETSESNFNFKKVGADG
ncbi:MAG: cyclohexanecarboxylate-CoA ligase, partial [Porticoccaceae bacterium]|nr:cyclohexanecarboxylate-CoA ligase [Porticoccaceae bacterium]